MAALLQRRSNTRAFTHPRRSLFDSLTHGNIGYNLRRNTHCFQYFHTTGRQDTKGTRKPAGIHALLQPADQRQCQQHAMKSPAIVLDT